MLETSAHGLIFTCGYHYSLFFDHFGEEIILVFAKDERYFLILGLTLSWGLKSDFPKNRISRASGVLCRQGELEFFWGGFQGSPVLGGDGRKVHQVGSTGDGDERCDREGHR